MGQQVIRAKQRHPSSLGYNSWLPLKFGSITLTGSKADSAVSARMPLGLSVKIPVIAVVLSGSPAGVVRFNLVAGDSSYHTAGVLASQTYTLTGTPTDGKTNTYTINGVAIACPQATANSLTQQAAADVLLINANTSVNTLIVATSAAGVITITALNTGTAANSITTVGTSDGGDTVTAGGATLAGGTNSTAITPAPPDNSLNGVVPPAVAAAGNALFDTNQTIYTSAPVIGGVGVVQLFYPTSAASAANPDQFDAIFGAGTDLTFRYQSSAAGAGTLDVTAYAIPVDIHPTKPEIGPFIPSLANL